MLPIQVVPYDAMWPDHFRRIATQIDTYLSIANVKFIKIEHIGSTSVPDLAAKPIIDIVIIVPDAEEAEKAKLALMYEPEPTEYYKFIGDGGIKGRFSMKFQDPDFVPRRSVYIIREDEQVGQLQIRGYRDLKNTLSKPEYGCLKKAYADVKLQMMAEGIEIGLEYGRRKNDIVRRILKVAGWTDEEVDEKESLDYRVDRDPPSPPF